MLRLILPFLLVGCSIAQEAPGNGYRPIEIDTTYSHDNWLTEPVDLRFDFAAYTVSFDSEDDDNNDGTKDVLGIPQWVSYEIKKQTQESEKYNRPRWMTADSLHEAGLAPDDATYAVSGTRDLKEVKTDYRFVRGHMCPKDAADRISAYAGYNTHTVLNAVPQLQWQNNGIWKKLEQQSLEWADKHEQIWVICGPVFFNQTPSMWLGEEDEVKAAIPDALFKIIIREADTKSGVETLAYIIPNILPKKEKDPKDFITTIQRIETLTGLQFLNSLCSEKNDAVKDSTGNPENW